MTTQSRLAYRCLLLPFAGALGGCFSPDPNLAGESLTDPGSDTGGDDGADSATSTSGATSPATAGGSDPTADSGPADSAGDTMSAGSSGDAGAPCGGACDHGVCSFEGVCECDEGFEGIDCEVDIDDCIDVDCGHGTCVDGTAASTCACEEGWEGAGCDALQMPLCLSGSLTVTDALDVVNGYPATGVFEPLQGQVVDLRLVFEVANSNVSVSGGGAGEPAGQLRTIETANFAVESSAAALAGFSADFAGTAQTIVLVNGPDQGVSLGNLVSPTGAEYWGLESGGVLDLPLSIDPLSGFPELLPSMGAGAGNLYLRRYQTGTPLMTDFAQATWAPALLNGPACTM
jgi:hypothetical protein